MLYHIVAIDKNGGIGKENSLPWEHNKEDMKLFKDLTLDSTVIMGRNTWESLPERNFKGVKTKALPKRVNVVISNSLVSNMVHSMNKYKGVYITKNLSFLNRKCPLLTDKKFIIGGESLYKQTINNIDVVYLTKFNEEYECDTFYPVDKLKSFKLQEVIKYKTFDLEIYTK